MIQKEGLRFVEAISMALCVMIAGTWQMPEWYAGNLDLMVRSDKLSLIGDLI